MSVFTASLGGLPMEKPNQITLRAMRGSVSTIPVITHPSNADNDNEGYVVTETGENGTQWKNRTDSSEKVYTYDEAIDLAGNGSYNLSLLVILSIATLSMGVDIFGFSVVVSGASCEFNLGIKETGVLLTVTFIGPILMSYPWGYISDTQGRRKSLLISLWTSFVISSISAFSPNWSTLAVLKLISTSFSSCAQSATYTLLGECSTRRFRDVYILIMTGVLDFSLTIYVVIAYFILNKDFAYHLGFVTFTPWRLLSLVLSMITGLGAVGVTYFYESPKFLLNQGKHGETLDVLAGIWRRNGRKLPYPVKSIILNEEGNIGSKEAYSWRSLWDQLVPIFKPPLLWRSLQLYFLTAVVYGTNNSYYIWLPYLGEQFVKNIGANETSGPTDLCSMIATKPNETYIIDEEICDTSVDISLVWFSLAQGVSFVLMMALIARIAHRKRFLMIAILLVSTLSGIGAVLIEDKTLGFLMLMGVLFNELVIGLIYSYFVELYPTSFRGMASCLATTAARTGALGGVSLLGAMLQSHCAESFYICSVLMFCSILVAFLLPKDQERPKAVE